MISPRGRSDRQGVSKLSAWEKPFFLAPHKRAKGRQDQYEPLLQELKFVTPVSSCAFALTHKEFPRNASLLCEDIYTCPFFLKCATKLLRSPAFTL